jgi:hypothetical protein
MTLNPTQISIILTLLVFAVIWILLSYSLYKIRKNDDIGDISGALNRDELRYIAKFRRTVRALIISYMYDGYQLKIIEDGTAIQANLTKSDFDRTGNIVINYKPVAINVAVDMYSLGLIRPTEQLFSPYIATKRAIIWAGFTLLRYRSIMKTVTDLSYER